MPIRLVATDLDGTLLHDDLSVSPRTRAALDAARAAGVQVVPVTARQPIGLRQIAEEAGFDEWAVCSNGALGVHLKSGEVIFEQTVGVAVQRRLASALKPLVDGLLFVSVRDGGEGFVPQQGYTAIAADRDHKRDVATMGSHTLEEVLAEPSLKLIVRHPDRPVDELLDIVRGAGVAGFAATHSGAPFVEVMAEGISKAWGIARLCDRLGITAEEVLAFGDAPNDAELLAWAGRGVAVANASAAALAAADEISPSNEEDGVAQVLEKLLLQQSVVIPTA